MATILFGIIRSLLVFQVLVSSGQNLHNRMFQSILKAPVLFFDRNPIGKFISKKKKSPEYLMYLLDCTNCTISGQLQFDGIFALWLGFFASFT